MKLGPGHRGWLAVLTTVALVEVFDKRTLSDVFLEMSKHPTGRYVVIPAWTVLTAHLFGVIPPRYDPLHQLAAHTFAKGRQPWVAPVYEV